MHFFDRLKATLRADAHGVIDALEDRALLLKQHLRDAELEVQRKRSRLVELAAALTRLDKDRERVEAERARHDRDAELALSEDADELARKAIARALPLVQLGQRIAERGAELREEQQALNTALATQEAELAALRTRVEAFLAAQAQPMAADGYAPAPVTEDQVELELLRRKRARREASDPARERGFAMSAPGLGRGLAFALIAGLGTMPWLVLTAPWLGAQAAFSAYLLMLPLAALAWCAPNLRRGLGAAALAALIAGPAALADLSPSAAFLCALFALGLGRSGICAPGPFARALFVELGLAFVAGLVALVLYDRSLLGSALAVWSFWLVQSAFALWPGRATAPDVLQGDAFERARTAAERLLHAK